ncbi:hypothetical protein [Rhizobium rhizogenes]|uniref:hypothetical protein n=1 Tax=Rhizobium rhizogenes TaxID=359 RepID=UPI001574238E|nr:hypothetical protein [Rhizobium rhizogenes]NTG07178.1 hypothetical protein [Rhizobium rhizogenes]
MSKIPDDIMRTANEVVTAWKGDGGGLMTLTARALLSERQRSYSLKALCDEMAKALERLADLTPAQANAASSSDLHLHVKAIANNALSAYRKAKEADHG